jgi:twitching motility protein PilT
MGFLTPEQVERVVDLQRRVIRQAQNQRAANARPEPAPPPPPAPTEPELTLTEEVPPDDTEAEFDDGDDDSTDTGTPGLVPPTRAPERAAPSAGDAALSRRELDSLLTEAAEAGASDVQIHTGAPIKFRVRGQLLDHGSPPLDAAAAEKLVLSSLGPEDRALFEQHGERDLSYSIDGVGRFRANVYRQLHGTDGIFRYIPPSPPTLDELGLPSSLAKLTTFNRGMVLITGPMSCGKSSTLAAFVNLINEERREHILTIEDPIEYVHESKRCLVNQRSVRRHTESFARALRAALREDPDVIVIGELRDRETIGLALSAAETGHFVLATLHTDNTIRTIGRIVGAFPPEQQEQVRAMLAGSLKAVLSQRLIPTQDEAGLVCALEIMLVSRAVGNLIRERKTVQMVSLLETGSSHGMCLLDQSLARLVSERKITRQQALRLCESPSRIPEGRGHAPRR